jgi:hypothetical protein
MSTEDNAPSTFSVVPAMYDAAGEMRKAIAPMEVLIPSIH